MQRVHTSDLPRCTFLCRRVLCKLQIFDMNQYTISTSVTKSSSTACGASVDNPSGTADKTTETTGKNTSIHATSVNSLIPVKLHQRGKRQHPYLMTESACARPATPQLGRGKTIHSRDCPHQKQVYGQPDQPENQSHPISISSFAQNSHCVITWTFIIRSRCRDHTYLVNQKGRGGHQWSLPP